MVMTLVHSESLAIAVSSLLLYSAMAFISYHYYQKFVMIERLNNHGVSSSTYYRSNLGKYDDTKKLFFIILMFSNILDIPEYINCIAQNGPDDCQTATIDFLLFWFCHLLALCGYACCIVIPCVLWSDMINKKDGKLVNSKFEDDNIKIFFKCVLLLYFTNMLFFIACSLVYFISSPSEYTSQLYYTICTFCEATLIIFISMGCLFSGINLLLYVKNAKLPEIIENKFIITLNIILFIMVLSFLGRAVLILRFSSFIPESYGKVIPYSAYTIISRWLPDIFCQYCLVLIMRFSGQEIIDKNSKIINFTGKRSNGSGYYYQYTIWRRLYDCFYCGYMKSHFCSCFFSPEDGDDKMQSTSGRSQFISNADDGLDGNHRDFVNYSMLTDPFISANDNENPLHFLEDADLIPRSSNKVFPPHDSNSFSSNKSNPHHPSEHHQSGHFHGASHGHGSLLAGNQFQYDDTANDLPIIMTRESFNSQRRFSQKTKSPSITQNDFLFIPGDVISIHEESYISTLGNSRATSED